MLSIIVTQCDAGLQGGVEMVVVVGGEDGGGRWSGWRW